MSDNRLTIIRQATEDDINWYMSVNPKYKYPKGPAFYALCECGNYCVVSATAKSCGCLKREKIVQANKMRGKAINPGDKFNDLTVIKQIDDKIVNGKAERWFECQCECGNICNVRGNELLTNGTKSCGCWQQRHNNYNFIDETGNVYGKLTVIECMPDKNSDNRTMWKCLCECGNIIITSGKSLRAGTCQSCGCIHSKGEQRVEEILRQLNIVYKKQYTFSDCRGKKNPLYYDFAIFTNDKLIALIEYQGIQHYEKIDHGFYLDKNQEEDWANDDKKREYCKLNNIKLIEIPYTDFNNLSKSYILEVLK